MSPPSCATAGRTRVSSSSLIWSMMSASAGSSSKSPGVRRDLDAGRAALPEQGRIEHEMIEQDRSTSGSSWSHSTVGRGRDRDEVASEIDAVDHAGGEQRLGQRAGLGGVGIGEVAPARLHHGPAGQELAGRRVGRLFDLDQHGRDVVAGGRSIKRRDRRLDMLLALGRAPAVVDHLDQRREVLARRRRGRRSAGRAPRPRRPSACRRRPPAAASIASFRSLSISAAANPPS